MHHLFHHQQNKSNSFKVSNKLPLLLFFLVVITTPLFSRAQIPQSTPSNSYPWTQKAEYSSQYYDWEPLRYFGPKYSGYLNAEESSAYVVPRINFKTSDVIAQKLGFTLDKDFFSGTENGKANVLGYIKRNDAQTVDITLFTYNKKGEKLWESDVLHYSEALGTATKNDQDLLPFVFLDIPVVDTEKDKFAIKDIETNQIIFGPMTFLTLGEVGKSSDKFLEEGTPFNSFEEWWYYKRPDSHPTEYFPTEAICKKSIDINFPGEPLVCYSTILKSVQVKLDMLRTKFKGPNRKVVFAVDTRGMELTLAMDISKSAGDKQVSTVKGLPDPITTDAGEFKKVEIPLVLASEEKPYYIKVYDQTTKQQFFAGMVNPSVSQLTRIFSNNDILSKTAAEILGTADISDELDTPVDVPPTPDITFVEDGVFQNPLAGSNVWNVVEFVQLLFRKLPYMARPALLISIALFGLNMIIHAKKTNAQEEVGKLRYILLGAGILLGTYALGTVISAVVRCFTGTSC